MATLASFDLVLILEWLVRHMHTPRTPPAPV